MYALNCNQVLLFSARSLACFLRKVEMRCSSTQWNHKNFIHSRKQSTEIYFIEMCKCNANVTQHLVDAFSSFFSRLRFLKERICGIDISPRSEMTQKINKKESQSWSIEDWTEITVARFAVAIIFNQTLIAQPSVHVKRLVLLQVMIIGAAWCFLVKRLLIGSNINGHLNF